MSLKYRYQNKEEVEARMGTQGTASLPWWNASLPWVLAVVACLLAGCMGTRPLRPGTARMHSGVGTNGVHEFISEMKQPENPAQSATQNYERTMETELPLPAGTRIVETAAGRSAAGRGKAVERGEENRRAEATEKTIVLSEPVVQRSRLTEKAGTAIGAAQKDSARELGVKLASLKGVVWVGLGLFLFGLGSLVYPPLRAVVGSVTTSGAMLLGGVALMVLPSLVVGNELLMLGGVAVVVAAWFLAHRHGELRGMVKAAGGQGGGAVRREGSVKG